MEKPVAKMVPQLSYHECAEWVGQQLGYDIRDTLGTFTNGESNPVEYRDYWHFLCGRFPIHNPCKIHISTDLLEDGTDWQNEITQKFVDEFGNATEMYVEW